MDAAYAPVNSSALINVSIASTALMSTARDERLALFEVATLSVIFVTIVFGNCCVLVALFPSRLRLRRMYFFMLHLCLADLITGFFNVLPQLIWDITYRFYGGNVLCKTIKLMQVFGPYLSSYVLVMTAVDRYQAICHPMRSVSARGAQSRARAMMRWAYGLSLLFASPQLLIFSYQQIGDGVYDCWGSFPQPYGERAYVTWYAITCFFTPLAILVFTYSRICFKLYSVLQKNGPEAFQNCPDGTLNDDPTESPVNVRRPPLSVSFKRLSELRRSLRLGEVVASNANRKKNRMLSEPRRHSMSGLTKAKVKSVKLTIVVILCYVICSLPFIVVQLWVYWSEDREQSALWTSPIITIVMLMASLNSSVNPWIYLLFNDNLMNNLKAVITCRNRQLRTRSVIHSL